MSPHDDAGGLVDGKVAHRAHSGPRLRMQTVEKTAILRFADAEVLFAEADVRAVGEQLKRLVEEGGYSRLLLNFSGVRYMSTGVLGILANLYRKLSPTGGRIMLCGLDPLLQDMVRITRLDNLLDVCTDEAEALGLVAYGGYRPDWCKNML